MSELNSRVTELAQLMSEFGLEEARMQGEGWRVQFGRAAARNHVSDEPDSDPTQRSGSAKTAGVREAVAEGTPISSPMMGIYYGAPSPGASPFVSEGDDVLAGQVIGLIEAMKVFNEITSTVSGKVLRVVKDSGQIVQPGEPILYVG